MAISKLDNPILFKKINIYRIFKKVWIKCSLIRILGENNLLKWEIEQLKIFGNPMVIPVGGSGIPFKRNISIRLKEINKSKRRIPKEFGIQTNWSRAQDVVLLFWIKHNLFDHQIKKFQILIYIHSLLGFE